MAPNGTAHRFDALPLLKRSMTICDKKMYTFTQSHSCTHTHKSNGSSLKCHWVALQQTMTNSVSLFSIWLSFFFLNSLESYTAYCLSISWYGFLLWCGLKMQKDSSRTPFKPFHFSFFVKPVRKHTQNDHAMDIWASKHVNMGTLCVLTMSKATVEAAISNIYVKFSEHYEESPEHSNIMQKWKK